MSDKLPAFQFYPGDWRKDPGIQACSLAARGLWVEMLCLMHESEPRGFLVLAGRAISPEQLARQTGGAVDEVRALLAELEAAGVFSRDENGVIYSRRMDRDEHIRRVRSEAGKLGSVHGHKGGRPKSADDEKRQKRQTERQTGGNRNGSDSAHGVSLGGDTPVEPSNGGCEGEKGGSETAKTANRTANGGQPKRQNNPPSSSSSSSEGIAADAATPPEKGSKPKKPRDRNPLFDAIANVTGSDLVVNASHVGKVAALLSKAEPPYAPDEVREFAARWRELLPWAKPSDHPRLTLGILEKHIPQIRAAGRDRSAAEPPRIKRAADNPFLNDHTDYAPMGEI